MPFSFKQTKLSEVILVEPRAFIDDRGFFMETYKYSDFSASGIAHRFVQDNHSFSIRGILRGLHYQNPPVAQGKLVRAVLGEIFDVAVDIRRESPTYGEWVGKTLSAANKRMLCVPPGFAHGFCVISDEAHVVYKVTEEYSPEHEAGILWSDPQIGIRWPVDHPIVSAKDARLPLLKEAENDFTYGE